MKYNIVGERERESGCDQNKVVNLIKFQYIKMGLLCV